MPTSTMTLAQLIASLNALQARYGDGEITVDAECPACGRVFPCGLGGVVALRPPTTPTVN